MKDEDFIEQKRKIMMNALEEKLDSETNDLMIQGDGENQ